MRTILLKELHAYSLFNKITHIFEADTSLLTVATGIVMPVDNPLIVKVN